MNAAAVRLGDFAATLLAPDRPAPAGLVGRDAVERERRLAVYRNNVLVNLIDALADTFPVTRALVGDAFFRQLARQRVLADPPRSPVLIDYADGFAAFIAGFAPAASLPYLADVAQLEALYMAAYHEADAAPLPSSGYAPWLADPPRLARCRVVLHPAARWMRSRHAVHAIWSAHQGLLDLCEADLGAIALHQPEDVLVARPALDVDVALLPEGAADFLDALRAGVVLGEAFARVLASQPGSDLSGIVSLLIRHGLVTRLVDAVDRDHVG